MQPIRILYLIDDLWSSRGGSEQHLLWLLRNVSSPEFEKDFIIFSHLRHPDDSIMEHRPIILGERFGAGCRSYLKRLRFLAQFIRDRQIDLVQAFNPKGELAAILACRWARRGRIVGNRRDCGYDQRASYRWIHWFSNRAGIGIIANSEAARQAAFRNDQTPLDHIEVIRNPISFERMKAGIHDTFDRQELPFENLSDGENIVGMVANVRPIKDYETLIQAAKIVLAKHPRTCFLFVGDHQSDYVNDLKNLASSLGVDDRICWFGGSDNPFRMIPLFDVAVLSTHSESFSNSVLEYAVAERPIVVTDVGGLGEIIRDGHSGFLVPERDPDALAEKIRWFLEHPEQARQFGRAAKDDVFQQYDETKILRQYGDFYRRTVGDGARSKP